eukprot:gene10679-22287_t
METIIREVTAQQTEGQTVMQSTRLTSPVSKRTRSGGAGSGNEVTIKLATLRQKLDLCVTDPAENIIYISLSTLGPFHGAFGRKNIKKGTCVARDGKGIFNSNGECPTVDSQFMSIKLKRYIEWKALPPRESYLKFIRGESSRILG